MSYALFLDDERLPQNKDKWVIARNFEIFKKIIHLRGFLDEISFDHDLGDGVPMGYNALKWILDEGLDLKKCKVNLHTANPVGEKNMQSLINTWHKVNT